MATSKTQEIHLNDCLDFMRGYTGKKFDVVVTSPPYNLNKKYGKYSDNLGYEEYLDWTDQWIQEVYNTLADTGSFFLNIGYTAKNPSMPFDVQHRTSKYFKTQNIFHWIKSISIPELNTSVGHFKPITTPRFVNQCHEYVFHFTKTGHVPLDKLSIGVPYADKSNITRWNHGNELRDRGNTWFIPYETKNGNMMHPCEFPVKLPEMCISLHGVKRGMLVYDPFMGIGSTAVACKRLDVNCVGTEIDPNYIDIARKRLHLDHVKLEKYA